MATVEISHDEFDEVRSTLGNDVARTGAMRWWKPLDGPAILQSEWIAWGTGSRVWVAVPTITELKD